MGSRTPPRFVPTLTEVVRGGAPARAEEIASQEQLVQRVMQRVDMSLERRLRESIAAAVLEQTRSLGPILREEIELVVREAVSQAFAEEIAAGQKPRK